MKLITIQNSMNALQNILNQEISGVTARKIARVIQQVNPELQPFQVGRQKIFDKYGELNGQLTIIPKDSPGMKELNKYDEAEVEYEFEKIPGKEFDECKIAAVDFLQLDWLIILDD